MTEENSVVFIIDDDASVREGLEDLFQSVGMAALSFGSPGEFLHSKRPDAPGCIVLDVRLPGQSGLEFQRQLAEADIHLPIIFILVASGQTPSDEMAKLSQTLSADIIWVGTLNDFGYHRNARHLQMAGRDLVNYSGGWSVSQRILNASTRQIMLSGTLQVSLRRPSRRQWTVG